MKKIGKKRVNLTIRSDLMQDAKTLHLNASEAAEAGIAAAVKKAKEEQWLEENKGAIAAYNARIEKEGLLIRPYWMDE